MTSYVPIGRITLAAHEVKVWNHITKNASPVEVIHRDTIDIDLIAEALTEGADERLFINGSGRIKYNINLLDTDIVNRGSCTCSPAEYGDIELIEAIFRDTRSLEDWAQLREDLVGVFEENIAVPGSSDFEVFLAPSGTDLVYYPLMLSRLVHGAKPILNVITCLEELGSGTKLAAEGKYHSEYGPFSQKLSKGRSILPPGAVDTVFFGARSERGAILAHDNEIEELIRVHKDHSVIINLVCGSKSGIEDSLHLIEDLHQENVIWSVDMCQFRHSKRVIRRLLDQGALVMLTGSKFYQAPPFCAAMLLPSKYSKQIMESAMWTEARRFSEVFTQIDLPREMRACAGLPHEVNRSSLIRWACAMREIRKYKSLPEVVRSSIVRSWNQTVIHEIRNHDNFELMPDQEKTNKTIISFRLKKDGRYLSHDELKALHLELALHPQDIAGQFKPVFLGQPVAYGDRSFLRIAIGAKNIRSFASNGDTTFDEDLAIIKLLAAKLSES